MNATEYFHFPRVVIPNHGRALLGGRLRTLSREEFTRLDQDYSTNYFSQENATVWEFMHDTDVDTTDSLGEDEPLRTAMLLYNALLAVTAGEFPDPRLSIRYTVVGESCTRTIGIFDRTTILDRKRGTRVSAKDLKSVAAQAESWQAHGLKHSDLVFAPLRGLSATATTTGDTVFQVAVVVALEGWLLPKPIRGIAHAMAERARALLGDAAPDDLRRQRGQVRF